MSSGTLLKVAFFLKRVLEKNSVMCYSLAMIEVSNVTKMFGNFRALSNVTFSIPTGQIVGLLGTNGAGKTTTMRMITGFLTPTSGRVLIDGVDISDNAVECKRKIGYMSESAPLYSDMVVYDYLKYVFKMYECTTGGGKLPSQRASQEEKIAELCDKCGLRAVMSKNIGELSRGNKQRVALAGALMNDPEILILDEPTSGLDPNQVEEVRTLIRTIGATKTVILSTHILSEAQLMCSRVIIINEGRVITDSPTAALSSQYNTNPIIHLSVKASDVALSSSLNGVSAIKSLSFKTDGDLTSAIVSCNTQKDIRSDIARAVVNAGLDLYELSIQKNSLEDVFHLLTEGPATTQGDDTTLGGKND